MSEQSDDYHRIEIECVRQSELDMHCVRGPMAGEMSLMKLSIVDRSVHESNGWALVS